METKEVTNIIEDIVRLNALAKERLVSQCPQLY